VEKNMPELFFPLTGDSVAQFSIAEPGVVFDETSVRKLLDRRGSTVAIASLCSSDRRASQVGEINSRQSLSPVSEKNKNSPAKSRRCDIRIRGSECFRNAARQRCNAGAGL
jgi:hypothetical protein